MTDALPPGYTFAIKDEDMERPDWLPERVSLNQPVVWGEPMGYPHARKVRCLHCDQEVWRSLRADDSLPPLCWTCADEAGIKR